MLWRRLAGETAMRQRPPRCAPLPGEGAAPRRLRLQ